MTEKSCFKCGLTKPTSEFYKHPRMADGLLGKCKPCTKHDVRENRARRLGYYQAYDRVRYYDNGPRGAASSEATRRGREAWNQRNPQKRRAHGRVAHAIRSGKLVRPDACQVCSAIGPVDAHHHDYEKPLDVVWLCEPCHGAHHRRYSEAESRAVIARRRHGRKRQRADQ